MRFGVVFGAYRFARERDAPDQFIPVVFIIRVDLAHPPPGEIPSGKTHRRRIRFEVKNINRLLVFVEDDIAEKIAFVNRIEQRSIFGFRLPQRFLGTGTFKPRPDAARDFAQQFDFVLAPVVRCGIEQTEIETPFVLMDERHADKRAYAQRSITLCVNPLVLRSIADNGDFPGAVEKFKFGREIVFCGVRAFHIGQIRFVPFVDDATRLLVFTDFGENDAGDVEMSADFCADRSHRFVNVRQMHQVLADFG